MAQARLIANLDCRADALDGARRVLLGRLGETVEFRERALDFSDPEGVHAMRVASRRLRSALRDFRSLLARRDIAHLGAHSKVFADKLGGVRDEDVAIIRLEELARDAPADVAPGLAALIAERRTRRDTARAALTAALTPEALAKLERTFVERLGAADADKSDDKSDDQSEDKHDKNKRSSGKHDAGKRQARTDFRDYGRERIRKQFARLRERAVSLYRPHDSEPLHDLRIEAKRLRYALELFGVCWSGELAFAADHVSELQSALGELHDCDVWIEDLHTHLVAAHDIYHRANDAADSFASDDRESRRLACVWLLDTFAKDRTKHYRRALALWSEWERTRFAAQLESALDGEARPSDAGGEQHGA